MVSIHKVSRTTMKTIIKQKQKALRIAQSAAAQSRLDAYIKNIAKSTQVKGKLYSQVGEVNENFSVRNLIYSINEFESSNWAPWSPVSRIKRHI